MRKRLATCHPDRPYYCKGLCKTCYYREWSHTHPGARYAIAKRWAQKHPEIYRAAQRRYRHKVRLRILKQYGGACACCGEKRPEFLALDHIKGNGHIERKTVGRHGSIQFYRWVLNHGNREDYRLLCHNCNLSLGFYGYCPHQKS